MPPKRGGKSASSTSNRSTDNSTPTSAGRKTSMTPRPSSAQQHQRGNTRHSPPHHRPERDDTVQTSSRRPSSSASSRQNHRRDSTASVSSMSSRSGHGRYSDIARHGLPMYGNESLGYSRPSSSPFPFGLPGHTVSEFDSFYDLLQGQAGAVGLGDGRRGRDGFEKFSATSSSLKKETGRGRPKLSSMTTATRQKEIPDFRHSFEVSMPLFSYDATTQQHQEYPALGRTGRGGVFGGESLEVGERVMRAGGLADGGGTRTKRSTTSSSTKEMGSGASISRTMSCRGTRTCELDLIKEADEVMKTAGIEKSPNPTRQGNEFFADEVKLGSDEKRHAAHEFKRLRKNLLESLDTGSAWKWEVLNAGSSYDGTKVTRSDEMDCMFFPSNVSEWMEIDFRGAPPGFCFVKLKKLRELNSEYKALKDLCEDHTMRIKATKFQQITFKLFKNGIANTHHAKAESAGPGAAALPVKYNVIPSSEGKGLLPISVDLVPALRFTMWPSELKTRLKKLPGIVEKGVEEVGLHVVPKPCLDDGYEGDRDFLWRLSFSAAEKEMTKFLDGKYRNPKGGVVTTCRKPVLRVMKRILELCKGFKNSKTKRFCANAKELKLAVTTLQKRRNVNIKHFCTFTIRTALWDSFYVQHRDDDHWHISKKRSRVQDTLELLKKMLMGQTNVSHFFVPELDIMSSVPVDEREFLYIIFTIVEKLF